MSSHVTDAILTTIRKAGFNIGETTCNRTGHLYTARAPTKYEAAVELALLCGFDLEE